MVTSSTLYHVPNFAQKSIQGNTGRDLCSKSTWSFFGCLSNRLFRNRAKVLHDSKDGTRCSPTRVEASPLQARSTILKNIAPSPFRTSAYDKKRV
jgi:hypothetical protein